MAQVIEEARKMLGKKVRVRLSEDESHDEENAIAEGKLLSFDDGGGFVVLDEMGFKHYCWPMLEIELI